MLPRQPSSDRAFAVTVPSTESGIARVPALTGALRRLSGGSSLATLIERRANNFDALRLLAALAVLFGHSFVLAAGHQDIATVDPLSRAMMGLTGFGEAIHEFAVNLFFVISGFLVTRSLQMRASLVEFVEARVLRLFPAAMLSAVLTVLLLAPLSTLPAGAYFADPATLQYLLRNATLWVVDYDLPGVFADNPYPGAVNGSLWTLPVELRCYLAVALLGLVALARPWLANLVFATLVVLFAVPEWSSLVTRDPAKWRLFLFFIAGAAFYVNRRFVPVGWLPLAGLAVLFAATTWAPRLHALAYVALVSYLTLLVALARPMPWPDRRRFGDVSYGVYLYAFPVQQALVAQLPGWRDGWAILLPATIVTLAFAALSWFAVERPALAAKGTLARWRRRRKVRASSA